MGGGEGGEVVKDMYCVNSYYVFTRWVGGRGEGWEVAKDMHYVNSYFAFTRWEGVVGCEGHALR